MRAPSFEPRRRAQLREELLGRARAWLTDWHPLDAGDFATALLQIAARLESEVTQRLDKVPDRTFRAFLDWLGVKAQPGRAARLPVVFTMTPGSDPVDAQGRVRLQVNSGDTPVIFETIDPLRILPGSLAAMVAVDPTQDAFYQPTAGVFNLQTPAAVPDRWQLKSDAPVGATTLQLDPPLGLAAGLTVADPSGQEYRITAVQGAIVTVEPPVGTIEPKGDTTPAAGSTLAAGTVVTRVDVFTPFSATERNRQQHALYIGSADGLKIDADAWIAIKNGAAIPSDASWSFSGKPSAAYPDGWIPIDSTTVIPQGSDLLLYKPAGSTIETLKVDAYQSRWLRATRTAGKIPATSHAIGLQLLVNCERPPSASTEVPEVTALEGIANTTPLVLSAGFYPFGREPRQFDSFYLGSKEAFSKPAAKITAAFSLGEKVAGARAAIGFSDTDYLTAGIGADGRLYRISHGVSAAGASPAPSVSFLSPTQPVADTGTPAMLTDHVVLPDVNETVGLRPGAALLGTDPYLSAGAGNEVWLWSRTGAGENWESLGAPDASAAAVWLTLLTGTSAGGQSSLAVYAIADGQLYRQDLRQSWAVENVGNTTGLIAMIAPVVRLADRAGNQQEDDGIVAITSLGEMYLRTAGVWAALNGGPAVVDETFYPLAVSGPAGTQFFSCDHNKLPWAFDTGHGAGFSAPGLKLLGDSLDFMPGGNEVAAVMLADAGSGPRMAVWAGAFDGLQPIFDTAAGQPAVAQGPLLVGESGATHFFFSSGNNGEALVLPVGQIEHVKAAAVDQAVILSNDPRNWAASAVTLIDLTPGLPANANRDVALVDTVLAGSTANRWIMVPGAHAPIPDGAVVQIYSSIVPPAPPGAPPGPKFLTGTMTAANKLKLDGTDSSAAVNGLVYLTDNAGAQFIVAIQVLAASIATLSANTTWAAGQHVQYTEIDAGVTRAIGVRPTLDLSGVDSSLTAGLSAATFGFDGAAAPDPQTASDVFPSANLAILGAAWTAPPGGNTIDFLAIVNLFQAWDTFAPPATNNPTLSWEYYDGTAWRPIAGLTDTTQALAQSGKVTFCVPKDLQATDVVGHTNNWIRARLVGGDYGQETVTVTTTPGSTPGSSVQTIDRSSDSIRAPYVGSLTITYEVCCAITPDVVLTLDNGELRDQTDVNASAGAIVDYFEPLGDALARIAGGDSSAGDRALFLGFDTPLTGGPIQILFLVIDGSFDAAYPLRVDALLGNRFKPVVTQDNTRGLNESGVLQTTLAESPQLTSLFGTTKYWLRLRPGTHLGNPDDWQPSIRAAYLNAGWAEAADTQFFEALGSSDGSPSQQFALARPPVIEGSLRLRVLEPLGDEDVTALKARGIEVDALLPNSNIPVRPGYSWVLWSEIPDTFGAAGTDRVYALDDVRGIVTFGDGQHGMIPPIGANVILAERYQRGGGEAANAVTAWSKINLVTPLSGVSAVVPPDGAAGGSDPQDAATTLRFAPANLRLRGRALTPADFEMLALQFSRDVAQARAIPTRGGIKVVVAMRGRDATPSAAVLRELRAYLLEAAPPMLAAEGVLRVTGPQEVFVRIALTVIVDAIDWSGAVAAAAEQALTDLFDPGTGGHDRLGWPLGDLPTDTDISAALVGIDHLEGMQPTTITRVDGQALTALRPTDLVRLAADGLTVNVLLPDTAVAP